MIRRLFLTLLCLSLTACAMQEEILEEPMVVEEEVIGAVPDACDAGDEDGIGGTGCEPVARDVPF